MKFSFIFLLLLPYALFCQEKELIVMFYNTENFFDTIDDPHKSDNEFLPSSKLKWNSEKYFNKIEKLALVIDSVGGPGLPSLVGLCEVENETCIADLIKHSPLKNSDFNFLVTNSPDVRSIDVALLYNTKDFKLKSHREINATNPELPENKTRNILYAVMQTPKKEILHVFVNHWPSMMGGEEESEPRRMYAATQLRLCIDSILKTDKDAKIVVMGDFNETPGKKAIKDVLGAFNTKDGSGTLLNPFAALAAEGQGSHCYKNEWNVLDQIMISRGLLNATRMHYKANSAAIFKHEMVLHTTAKEKLKVPNRTFKGSKYYNGFSDHLPVYLILKQK